MSHITTRLLNAIAPGPSSITLAPSNRLDVNTLIEALSALHRLHSKVVVVKYGGNALIDTALKHHFAQDIVLLKQAGIQPIIVHGGGPQIDAALEKMGRQSVFAQGLRVTDSETLRVVEGVLCGSIQQEIVTQIHQCGGRAVGLTGKDGGLLQARPLRLPDRVNPGQWIDVGQVGEIEAVHPALLQTVQENGFIPVISPLGNSREGISYNINADWVAGKLASALNAEMLLIMTDVTGVMDQQGRVLPELYLHEIEALIEEGTLSRGMLPKIAAAVDAAKNGVSSVRILDGRIEHSVLLELLSGQSSGTVIYADQGDVRGASEEILLETNCTNTSPSLTIPSS